MDARYKVDAPIMSWPVLWVIHINKCRSVQLLGQCIVPYDTYHLINCILTYCIFMFVHAYLYWKKDFPFLMYYHYKMYTLLHIQLLLV